MLGILHVYFFILKIILKNPYNNKNLGHKLGQNWAIRKRKNVVVFDALFLYLYV